MIMHMKSSKKLNTQLLLEVVFFGSYLRLGWKLSNLTDNLLSSVQPLNTQYLTCPHARFVKAAFNLQLLIKQSIYLTHFIPFWYTNTPYFNFILHIYKPLKKFTVMQCFLLAYSKGSGQKLDWILDDWLPGCLLAQR